MMMLLIPNRPGFQIQRRLRLPAGGGEIGHLPGRISERYANFAGCPMPRTRPFLRMEP